jgi:gold/copper resistance efflux system membrane fusion protein
VLVVGENNQAQYRPIELGPVVDGLRVINGGLQAGEKIIIKASCAPAWRSRRAWPWCPRHRPPARPARPRLRQTPGSRCGACQAGGADPAKADGAAGSAEARK